jgi:hypothetical protein
MRRRAWFLAWFVAATPAGAQPAGLERAVVERGEAADPAAVVEGTAGEGWWLGWSVPAMEHRDLCCYDGGFRRRGCTLAGRAANFSVSEARSARLGEPALVVFARAEARRVAALLLVSPDCPVDGRGAEVLWLDGVEPASSLALLDDVAQGDDGDLASEAVAAIAQHAGGDPDRRLPEELRRDAIFWLGEARRRAGYEALARLIASETDDDLVEHLVFALQLSPVPEATALLERLAREGQSSELRREALFWLSQEGEPGVEELLRAAAVGDPDPEVREHAVFALSQLPDERAVDGLVALLRSAGEREVQRQALFWLSQAEDPRALAAVERLLDE